MSFQHLPNTYPKIEGKILMKIDAIRNINNNIRQQNSKQKGVQSARLQEQKSGVYNPFYYQDYALNISFKGGRNPKDFYDFNKDRMPSTMNDYLNASFEERSQLAPVQVLQEAYDDLHIATTVEDIKELYPNEGKFKDLKPANYVGAKTGVMRKIKEIKDMQEVPEPVFKDGTDDLTTYIVKKIYLEGKTVKEIDKDFAKDINPVYELAAKVSDDTKKTVGKNESVYFSNSTTQSLGIKFPNVAFWNSFIHTRDDYEIVKRVKTSTGKFVNADSPEGRQATAVKTEKPKAPNRYNFKKDGVKRVSDTIANSKGDPKDALKELKRRGRDTEELTFVQKYWSQIMSVATERVRLSEELIDFNATRENSPKVVNDAVDRFINGIEFTKREKTPLQIFWNERTDLKGHFSNAISDTILLFSESFGADGNNEEFQSLMKYADNIRPNREAKKLEHEKIQAEYDKLAEELNAQEASKNAGKSIIESAKEEISNVQSKLTPKPEVYKYDINGEQLILNFDVKKHALELFQGNFEMIPNKLSNTYMAELTDIHGDDTRYWLTCCYSSGPQNEQLKRLVMSDDEIHQINDEIISRMDSKHNDLLESSRIAMLQYADENKLLTEEEMRKFSSLDIIAVRDKIKERLTVDPKRATAEIQTKFNELHKPLSSKEKNKIRINLFHHLKSGGFQAGYFAPHEETLFETMKLMSRATNEKPKLAETYKSVLSSERLFDFEGASLRYILKPDANPTIANIVRNHALTHTVILFPVEIFSLNGAYPQEYRRIADAELARLGESKDTLEKSMQTAHKVFQTMTTGATSATKELVGKATLNAIKNLK